MKSTLLCAFLALATFVWLGDAAKDLGKLECDEKEGMKPNGNMVKTIMDKCMPKAGEDGKKVVAGMVKCLIKQHKGIDTKTGKMKKKEAMLLINIFPDKFKDQITKKFEECYEKHSAGIKKEKNGCDSWMPFTECFYEFGQSLCPKKP